MLVSLTVGKVDAGVAVLLTEDKRLIEFPSILLPPSISSGSIVDITVSRNLASEAAARSAFESLQNSIFETYGQKTPSPPALRCRTATQTSVVLEWDPIELATAECRSLFLYRNGSRAGAIPYPLETTSTKISGLAIDTEYTFQLVLRTSAGTYSSQKLEVRTHKMTDLSGITVTPGVLPAQLRYSLASAVERIGGRIVDSIRLDTTHFVCTEGRGREWEKAVELNIPVVRPEWIDGCEREGRIVGVRGYYLNADPRLRQIGPNPKVQSRRTESQTNIQRVPPSAESLAPSSGTGQSAAGTPISGISPGHVQSSSTSTGGGPPTPPAKDGMPSRNVSQPASARSASGALPDPNVAAFSNSGTLRKATVEDDRSSDESPEGEEEEEEEEEEHEEGEGNGSAEKGIEDRHSAKRNSMKSSQASRTLVQSPFDSASKERTLQEESMQPPDDISRKPSEVGSFSDVPL